MTFDDIPGFSEGHKKCMRVILDTAAEIPRPFSVIPVVIAYEQPDGTIAVGVSDANDARDSTRGHPDLMQALVLGFKKSATMREPVVVLAVDAAKMCIATSIEFGDAVSKDVLTAAKAEKLLN
jgi:hypothetical protein